jgi:energy-converting hydrogenase Eha subunit C
MYICIQEQRILKLLFILVCVCGGGGLILHGTPLYVYAVASHGPGSA